jgi:hypothetical protein
MTDISKPRPRLLVRQLPYEVDPKEHLVLAFMIQLLPRRTEIAGQFPTLVYQALVEPRS